MKAYWVGIYEKHSHGKYGKDFFTAWQLCGNSKAQVKELAYELISTSTWRDIFQTLPITEQIAIMMIPFDVKHAHGRDKALDAQIGKYAESFFSVKVEIDA